MAYVQVAKGARYLTAIVLALALLGVMLNSTGLFDAGIAGATKVRYLAGALPTVFFLAAIAIVQRAHAKIAGGEAVLPALGKLLERLGVCLFLGGMARVFGELLLVRLILGAQTSWAWFDVAAITLGCVGLLLLALARPLRDAAMAHAELAEIL